MEEQKQPPEVFYKVFLEILQNSRKSTSARVSFFNKVAGRACNFIKRDSGTGVFL